MELSIFEIFDRSDMCDVDDGILYSILAVWTFSMIQFTFPLSAKKQTKEYRPNRSCIDHYCSWFYETEIWSLLLSVLFQDGPFFGVRLYCLVNYSMYSYEIIFFTSKNALVILLQFYRAIAVIKTRRYDKEQRDTTDNAINDNFSTRAPSMGETNHWDTGSYIGERL